MPSFLHEAIVQLFRNRPALAVELLRGPLGVEVPRYAEVRLESPDLSELVPTELRADAVVLLLHGRPVLGIVVEVQLHAAARKRWVWPAYLAVLRAKLRCPALLLVVTPWATVAR